LIRLHAISDDCNTTDNDLVPVHIRSDTCGSPTWDDLVRSTTFQYVYIRPLRSVAIRNDCGCRLCRVAWCGKKAINIVISHFLQGSQHHRKGIANGSVGLLEATATSSFSATEKDTTFRGFRVSMWGHRKLNFSHTHCSVVIMSVTTSASLPVYIALFFSLPNMVRMLVYHIRSSDTVVFILTACAAENSFFLLTSLNPARRLL